ncbi:MAG: hypothetical protein K0B07_04335 [DPANN group archaeon]|nr:hypothetical protein [DPANN group archaeon]
MNIMTKRTGLIFTLDALIALILVMGVYVFVMDYNSSPLQQKTNYQQLHFTAVDGMNIFSKTVFDNINQTLREHILENTEVGSYDINKTLPDIIGKLWAYNDTGYASLIVEQFFENIIPAHYGYSVKIKGVVDDTLIYASSGLRPDIEVSKFSVSSYRIISGYEEDIPSESFVASAWAVEARKNSTKIFPFNLGGGGWGGENFTVDKYFTLPQNTTISEATFVFSFHYYPDIEEILVNGESFDESDINWIYYEYDSGAGYGAYGTINSTRLKDSISEEDNHIRLILKNGEYNSHVHPGMYLKVQYQSDLLYEPIQKRFSLDNMVGAAAAWQVQAFHIPKDANITNATLHIEGHHVDKKISIWVNDNEIYSVVNPSSSNVNLNFTFSEIINDIHATSSSGSYYSTGETNTLAVYLDINPMGNQPVTGGSGECEISNESYIELEYTVTGGILRYGMIEVTGVEEFNNGGPELIKKSNFTLPDRDITKAFIHLAQYYSWMVAIAVWNEDEDEPSWRGNEWEEYQIFKSPTGRAVPTDIYVPLDRLNKGEVNWIKVRDGFLGGSSDNTILPESTFEFSILVPSMVGYGDNFPTREDAITDANSRLDDILGEYAEATAIDNEAISMSQVPWMWGPVYLTFEIWK